MSAVEVVGRGGGNGGGFYWEDGEKGVGNGEAEEGLGIIRDPDAIEPEVSEAKR